MAKKNEPHPLADEETAMDRIADALTAAFTGGPGGMSQATLDHLISMGLRYGLDEHAGALRDIAGALNNIADAIRGREE